MVTNNNKAATSRVAVSTRAVRDFYLLQAPFLNCWVPQTAVVTVAQATVAVPRAVTVVAVSRDSVRRRDYRG